MKYTLFFLSLSSISLAATCEKGYFRSAADKPCNYACSDGCKGGTCAEIGGACTDTSGCEEGWQNTSAESKDCASPICFGGRACSEGGKCVAPNQCICGESGAQIVAKYGDYPSKDGETEVKGYDCVSLRKDGIWGAGIALV